MEVCQLVETLVLSKLKNFSRNNTFGLYRDDGLAIIKVLSGRQIERLKKNVVKTFKDCRLNITNEADLHMYLYSGSAFLAI